MYYLFISAGDARTASGQSDAPGQPDTPGQPDAPVGHRDLMTWDHGSFMNFNNFMTLVMVSHR